MPRIIQTMTLKSQLIGLNLDMLPKHTNKPSGSARTNVSINKRQVVPKPVNSCCVASEKFIVIALSIISVF